MLSMRIDDEIAERNAKIDALVAKVKQAQSTGKVRKVADWNKLIRSHEYIVRLLERANK